VNVRKGSKKQLNLEDVSSRKERKAKTRKARKGVEGILLLPFVVSAPSLRSSA